MALGWGSCGCVMGWSLMDRWDKLRLFVALLMGGLTSPAYLRGFTSLVQGMDWLLTVIHGHVVAYTINVADDS